MRFKRNNRDERLKKAIKFAKRYNCKLTYFDGQEFPVDMVNGAYEEEAPIEDVWDADKYKVAIEVVAEIRKAITNGHRAQCLEKDAEIVSAIKSALSDAELSYVEFIS